MAKRRRAPRKRSPRKRTNPPELRKVHAGLESAYLAAIARKDKASRALAKRIKGPWVAVEKMLARGRVPRGNPGRWWFVRRGLTVHRFDSLSEAKAFQRGEGGALVASSGPEYNAALMDYGAQAAKLGIHRLPRRNPRKRASSRRVAYSVKRAGKVVGKVVASSRAAAQREATKAGYVLGPRRKMLRNPPRGAVLSERAESITYQHDEDGEWYRHTWRPGVAVKVSPDHKSVTLYRPDGKPVAGNFWVPKRAR